MRSSYFQPCFTTPPGGVSRGKGLDDIRIAPLFVQRTVPQSNAEQGRSSGRRIWIAVVKVVRRRRRALRKEMNRGICEIRGTRTGRKSVFRVFRVFSGLCFLPSVAALPRCVHLGPSVDGSCLSTTSNRPTGIRNAAASGADTSGASPRSGFLRKKHVARRFIVGFRPRAALYDMK